MDAREFLSGEMKKSWEEANQDPKTKFKYIQFFQIGDTGKTQIWACLNNKSGEELGKVKWHGPWRQYCFTPSQPSVYSAGCMDDIAGFIRILMDERKQEKENG